MAFVLRIKFFSMRLIRKILWVLFVAVLAAGHLILMILWLIFGVAVWLHYFPHKDKKAEVHSPAGPQKAFIREWSDIDCICKSVYFFDGTRTKKTEPFLEEYVRTDTLVFTADGKYLVALINECDLHVFDGRTGKDLTGRCSLIAYDNRYYSQRWRFVRLSKDTLVIQSYNPEDFYPANLNKPPSSRPLRERRLLLPNLKDV